MQKDLENLPRETVAICMNCLYGNPQFLRLADMAINKYGYISCVFRHHQIPDDHIFKSKKECEAYLIWLIPSVKNEKRRKQLQFILEHILRSHFE